MRPPLLRRAERIKLVAMDVDGVLTGGEIIVLESGEEVKIWNSKDRLCFAVLREKKVPLSFAWVTGRSSKSVLWAAQDLGIHHLFQKCSDKKSALASVLERRKLDWDHVAYVGDDLIDLPVLKKAGFSACPSDAARDIQKNVHYISPFPGGKGVARDVLEFILRAQKKWDSLVASFLG